MMILLIEREIKISCLQSVDVDLMEIGYLKCAEEEIYNFFKIFGW
jgi:hypothetical protein